MSGCSTSGGCGGWESSSVRVCVSIRAQGSQAEGSSAHTDTHSVYRFLSLSLSQSLTHPNTQTNTYSVHTVQYEYIRVHTTTSRLSRILRLMQMRAYVYNINSVFSYSMLETCALSGCCCASPPVARPVLEAKRDAALLLAPTNVQYQQQ